MSRSPRVMASPRDVEALYQDVLAGRVRRTPDGRFWRDVMAGYGSLRRDARRCDTAVRVLQEQNRIQVTEDGVVTPINAG